MVQLEPWAKQRTNYCIFARIYSALLSPALCPSELSIFPLICLGVRRPLTYLLTPALEAMDTGIWWPLGLPCKDTQIMSLPHPCWWVLSS